MGFQFMLTLTVGTLLSQLASSWHPDDVPLVNPLSPIIGLNDVSGDIEGPFTGVRSASTMLDEAQEEKSHGVPGLEEFRNNIFKFSSYVPSR
jgi:hypothetical protein